MVDEQNMKTEHWWKDTDREKPRNAEKDIRLCLLVVFVPNSPKSNKISDKDRHCSDI
jgi:hypothetical protein